MDDLTDKKIENSTSAPAMVSERSEAENSAAVAVADKEPDDVTGFHQLFGADLERALAEIGSTAPVTQTRTLTTAQRQRQRRPNPAIELAEVPAEVAADAPTPPRPNVLDLPDPELWPDPVIGSDVLSAIAETFLRYVVLPDGAADALTLWAAHTHCFELFQCTPRLNLSSPEKGCGKSTLRDVMAQIVSRPLPTEHLTPAVLFRLIDEQQPTLLADECDAWLLENEQLRGMLNAGHRRGGQIFRYDGRLGAARGFSVFAPVVLCGIGKLPDTLHSRSIMIMLNRARHREIRERFDSRRVDREIELRRKLARYCADNQSRLEGCEPVLPANASNRVGDNWRPLFAIAEIAGGDWPRRAASAFANLVVEDTDEQGTGTMLLTDIQHVFMARNTGKLFSQLLVEALCAMVERPWLEAHKGRRINEIWLANTLRNYGIKPTTLRIGRICKKGYHVADFQDAFDRYAPPVRVPSRNTVTMPESIGDFQI